MFPKNRFENDPRTTDELVNAALVETDEEISWDAVCSLHWKGSREVLERAELLATSNCPRERRLGADILGQLGVPDRSFPEQCKSVLRSMLSDGEEAIVLKSVLTALSHQDDPDAVPFVAKFSTHADSNVRRAAVLALSGHEIPLAIESLIKLSSDASSSHVRDWATFALGSLIEIDSLQIREALVERLQDSDDDTRAEAVIGLARRKDVRVVAALKEELATDCVGTLIVEAAELMASNELYPQLIALREWWDVDSDLLERAIAVSQV